MALAQVKKYIADGIEHVPGWCSPIFMEIVAHLAEEMKIARVVGGACEIGVYYGKFLIGLSHAVEGRASLAIDLFDRQAENVDHSGASQDDLMAKFQGNVAKYGCGPIACMRANSFALTVRDQVALLDRFEPFQFFSIDGGHQPEHVINDYRFAEEVTHHGGAIIIDDITNSAWPGVMEGIAWLFLNTRPKFVPLMIGHNKLVLAGVTFHKLYLTGMANRIKQHIPGQNIWTTKLFGYELLSFV